MKTVLMVGILVVLLGGGLAAWGGTEDVPPQIIAVQPYPGEEMRVDQTLTLVFNQAMDRASVEAAFQIETPGSFAWTDDRTLVFAPAENWQRGGSYAVSIGESASAQNGLALPEAYTFTIRIVGTLQVASTIPDNGVEGIGADATITVAFNRPVVALVATSELADLPNPLDITPSLAGAGEWLNTSIYQFTPTQALDGGTTYTVTVKAGLEDVSGGLLEEDFVFSFQTLLPEILSTYPQEGSTGVRLEDTLNIRFSQPMNTAATGAAFSVKLRGEPVAGEISWSEDGTTLNFAPAQRLQIESSYQFVLDAAAAKGASGAALRQGRDFIFNTVTLPYVVASYPSDGQRDVYPGYNTVSLSFGTPMNTETFADRVIIDPEPSSVTPYVSGNQGLNLEFEFKPETHYTVTFKAGAEDIYGNAIAADYTFSFHTTRIEANFSLTESGRFVVTGGYRQDTVVPAWISANPAVTFELYRFQRKNLPDAAWRLYDDNSAQTLMREGERVREWSQVFQGESAYQNVVVNLASEEGGALPLGLYILRARQVGFNTYPSYLAMGVVNSNVTFKRMDDEILIWVTDMPSAEPLPDQEINIYQGDQVVAKGVTDANGVLRLRLDDALDGAFLAITSESEGRFGVWYSTSAPSINPRDVYLYTDRPIYRPGETVYFRGAYRVRDDVSFRPDATETLKINVNVNYGQQLLLEDTLVLNQFGTFNGAIDLPEDAAIGTLNFEIYDLNGAWLGSASAQIAEFRVPEFQVGVAPALDEIISGDPLRALVNSTYFSGGVVSNANLTWFISATTTSFRYAGPGSYSFSESTGYYGYYDYYDEFSSYGYPGGRYIAEGSGTTDSNGGFLIDYADTALQATNPETWVVEATVSDESGQYISGRAGVTVHPAEVYVGVRTAAYFGREGQALDAEIITVTPQSAAVPGQNVDLMLIERRWERQDIEGQFGRYTWEMREIEVEKVRLTTDADGKAAHTFTPPNAGIFLIKAETRDTRERLHRSARQVWVMGQTYVWWGQPSDTIELIADAEGYTPGDTAQILVPVSLEGTSYLLVTIERDGVMALDVVKVEGSTYVYELPITDDHAPTVYVSVMLMHGIDAANTTPIYRQGNLALAVEPVAKRLEVTLKPSALTTQPGETLTIDIEARDASGNPTQAEIGIAMVDAAILTLAPPNSLAPESHYYGNAPNLTYTETMLSALMDKRLDDVFGDEKSRDEAALEEQEMAADGVAVGRNAADTAFAAAPAAEAMPDAAGGGGGFESVTVRQDFQQTPLWEPSVVTDVDGQAQVTVTLPDNLTIWNLNARALTSDTRVGEAVVDIASTLPLLVRPATPRFFVVGDEVTLAMVVNNNTAAAQTVRTAMQGTGFELMEGESLEQAVEIDASSRARVEWRVRILDVPSVDLTFFAIGADGYQDAAKPPLATGENGTIPVYRYTAPDTVGTGGVLREGGAITEGISIPPYADTDQGTLTIQLDPSLAVTTLDALDYLKNFPHQCIEQTVSRFLPNVMTYRALRSLGVDDPELEANLRVAMDEAIKKLQNEQAPDGGWGWFVGMESNPLVTAYAVLGLAEARAAGYDIDSTMIRRGAEFVRSHVIRLDEDSAPWLLNRQAFFLYVLSRLDMVAPRELHMLYDLRLEMSLYAKGYLLMSYAHLAPDSRDQIEALKSDLISAAHLSATGAHWEEPFTDWWNWNTDIRSTSIVLSALLKVDPQNPLLPNAVRWLMVARRGDHWTTTQETAWAVLALTDWMVATNELQGDYDYALTLNSAEQTSGQVTPQNVRDGQKLVIDVKDLLLDEINRVTVIRGEGEGALYYTAHLRLRLDASAVEAIDRGVGIVREYFAAGGETPISEANMGDIITVRLTVTVPETIYYFVLEDPLPAGTEALDTSLLTTTNAVTGPQLQPAYNPYYWWWWWVWDHTEIRDEQVNLYADNLPPGTYVYSYQVQATVPGKFQTMPAQGYAFYFPELFGRSDGTLFTVK